MDERVGHQLANRRFWVQGDSLPQGLADHLVAGQDAIDERVESLETIRVALVPNPLSHRLDATVALADDEEKLAAAGQIVRLVFAPAEKKSNDATAGGGSAGGSKGPEGEGAKGEAA
jgi:hypothetical protein